MHISFLKKGRSIELRCAQRRSASIIVVTLAIISMSEFASGAVITPSICLQLSACSAAPYDESESVAEDRTLPEMPSRVPYDVPDIPNRLIHCIFQPSSTSRPGSNGSPYSDTLCKAIATRSENFALPCVCAICSGDKPHFVPPSSRDRIFHPPRSSF